MLNVFPRGRVIPSDDVIGRHGFVHELEERLFLGDSAMLAGPRRIGKTSVAFDVLWKLRDRGCYTVDIDLFHIPTSAELGLQIMRKVLQVRTGLLRTATHTIKGFLEFISKAEIAIKLQDLEITSRLGEVSDNPISVLDEAFLIAERIAENDNRRLIILFDEFQEIERIGGEILLKRLRSIFQHQQYVSYLFLGSEPSMMRTIFADRRQAFYRFATMLHLPDIGSDEWEEYVLRKLNQANLTMSGNAFDVLMQDTGGHPYCVMTVLFDAFLLSQIERKTQIDSEMIKNSLIRAFSQLEAIYDELWKRTLEIRGADEVLLALAEGTPPYRTNESVVVKRAINKLMDTSILKKIERGHYEFVEPMFKTWILNKVGN